MDAATIIAIAGTVGAVAMGGMLLLIKRAPDGYQDATGFHYGDCPDDAPWALPEPANSNLPALTEAQATVLHAMSPAIGFRADTLARWTGLPHAEVSAVRRQLRELGLAHYGPLFDEDSGRPNGSGYTLTDEGVRVQLAIRDMAVAA